MQVRIVDIDPQGALAQGLLDDAALEVRPLYEKAPTDSASPPANTPRGPRDCYVAAFIKDTPVGCGALREFDLVSAEAQRIYVCPEHRRKGVARAVLLHLIAEARRLRYQRIILETGNRQAAAAALYRDAGFKRIAPFGEYVADPTSICFELLV
jgi:putative acetyltransferase